MRTKRNAWNNNVATFPSNIVVYYLFCYIYFLSLYHFFVITQFPWNSYYWIFFFLFSRWYNYESALIALFSLWFQKNFLSSTLSKCFIFFFFLVSFFYFKQFRLIIYLYSFQIKLQQNHVFVFEIHSYFLVGDVCKTNEQTKIDKTRNIITTKDVTQINHFRLVSTITTNHLKRYHSRCNRI